MSWDRHTNVAGLNRIKESQPSPFFIVRYPAARYKQAKHMHRFASTKKTHHKNENDKISKDSTKTGSVNAPS
jgi:hypothetical protein